MTFQTKDDLIDLAKRIVERAPRCVTEESTKLSLILPFIAALGYDDRDPGEVCPEHNCDFSDKYKNKVDFAIIKSGEPIIAIECKAHGATLRDDRGQLRSYFNAAATVKMGILTDGVVWEFYADSDSPNMMDEKAFLEVDFKQIAKGNIEDSAFDALSGMKRGAFDPENIGAEAKRKLVFRSVIDQLTQWAESPSDDVGRLLLSNAGIRRVGQKVLDEYKPLISQAFKEYVAEQIISRLDLPKKDATDRSPVVQSTTPFPTATPASVDGIVTTNTERAVYDWALRRLAFLVKDDNLFREIEKIEYRDYHSRFAVFYKQERAGRLFTFNEAKKSPIHRFEFPGSITVNTDNLFDIDAPLLDSFRKAVASLGASKA